VVAADPRRVPGLGASRRLGSVSGAFSSPGTHCGVDPRHQSQPRVDDRLELLMGSLGVGLRGLARGSVGGKVARSCGRNRSVCLPFGAARPQKIGTWPRRKPWLAGGWRGPSPTRWSPLALNHRLIPSGRLLTPAMAAPTPILLPGPLAARCADRPGIPCLRQVTPKTHPVFRAIQSRTLLESHPFS